MPRSPRNLVIVRAGDRSLHPAWTTSLASRDWDLVVSYFGRDEQRYRGDGARRIDDPGLKFPGLHALLSRETFWRDYDHVWLPDDDLMIGQDGISRLFRIVAELELQVAQPALSWTSFYSHRITLKYPSFRARFTDFVEIMAPCFRREFLERCLHTLGETQSGWGLDWVWPKVLANGPMRCAILDDVEMTHTRPVGGPTYGALRDRGISAADEGAALMQRYGIARGQAPSVIAAIARDGRLLAAATPADVVLLRERIAHDEQLFLASRSRVETAPVVLVMPPAERGRRWGR
ncbi:MAG: DUF707 domain-containing protein [Betaproteobacteria bacterium]